MRDLAQPFFEEMQRLGWTEGTNITYERLSGRGAREYVENLAKTAADLEPQVIFATTGTLEVTRADAPAEPTIANDAAGRNFQTACG